MNVLSYRLWWLKVWGMGLVLAALVPSGVFAGVECPQDGEYYLVTRTCEQVELVETRMIVVSRSGGVDQNQVAATVNAQAADPFQVTELPFPPINNASGTVALTRAPGSATSIRSQIAGLAQHVAEDWLFLPVFTDAGEEQWRRVSVPIFVLFEPWVSELGQLTTLLDVFPGAEIVPQVYYQEAFSPGIDYWEVFPDTKDGFVLYEGLHALNRRGEVYLASMDCQWCEGPSGGGGGSGSAPLESIPVLSPVGLLGLVSGLGLFAVFRIRRR